VSQATEQRFRKLKSCEARTGLTSLLLHYPPFDGHEQAMQSPRLFAEQVRPEFRPRESAGSQAAAIASAALQVSCQP
jgi:hypothetical protein